MEQNWKYDGKVLCLLLQINGEMINELEIIITIIKIDTLAEKLEPIDFSPLKSVHKNKVMPVT